MRKQSKITRALCAGLMLVLSLFITEAHAQVVCSAALVDAEYQYALGQYDEAVIAAHQCLEASDVPDSALDQTYRLLALSYLGAGQPDEARAAVEKLLDRVPDYQSGADPEAFAGLLDTMRRERGLVRSGDEKEYVEIEVFYGTDRKSTGSDDPGEYYGGERGAFEVGSCMVSIPKGHQTGKLESPSWFRFEFSEDPSKHLMLHEVTPMEEAGMYEKLRASLNESEEKGLLVFVHGYNVTFENAARRMAQLTYDLGFDGAPVFYSWPANGSTLDYPADEADVQWTVPHLRDFILDLAEKSGARKINLIAHSMGNRAVTAALREIAPSRSEPLFKEVILTAPDIDADIFTRDIIPAILPVAGRITLYASSKDRALQLSNKIHQYPRAGESGDHLVVLTGIDTVDASEVDTDLLGHSYFAEAEPLLSDLNLLLRNSFPPDQRNLLERAKSRLKYWLFH